MNDRKMLTDDERNIFRLIEMNDVDGLTRLLRQDYSTGTCLNINCFNKDGFTPLMDAANRNDAINEIITILLESGADINLCSNDARYKNTALHAACENGSLNNAKLLLLHGSNPNVRNEVLRTPLHDACRCWKIDVMIALLDFKADCNIQDNCLCIPLHYVVLYGIYNERVDLLQAVLLLLDYGADVNTRGQFGATPLHAAIRAIVITYNNRNKIPVRVLVLIQLLLESHSNINVELEVTSGDACKIYKGDTPLHCAVRFELFEIVKMLLEYNPKPFHVETAFHIAKTNLESVPLNDNDQKIIRLQNIVDCIAVKRRQQIYLCLLIRWGNTII